MAGVEGHKCDSPDCDNDATLVCPTCVKLGLPPSYFCSQDCFKANWKTHKRLHTLVEAGPVAPSYNPWPGFSFSGPLRPHPQSPRREVPAHIVKPDYADSGNPKSERAIKDSTAIDVKTPEQIAALRVAAEFGREILDIAGKHIEPGVTCDEIDRIVHEATIRRNGYPSPLNYKEFPKSVCTSVNEVICHGIPDAYALKDGDIVNVDVSIYHNGVHADLNETFLVGNVDAAGRKLCQVTKECVDRAIAVVKPGVRYRDIGDVIDAHATANGLSVVRAYCGHGIGTLFHSNPSVPHYKKNKAIGIMRPGHVFTIEPMINEGTWKEKLWPDDWTAVTADGRRSAQFEQMVLVTEDGVEVLTRRRHGSWDDPKSVPVYAAEYCAENGIAWDGKPGVYQE